MIQSCLVNISASQSLKETATLYDTVEGREKAFQQSVKVALSRFEGAQATDVLALIDPIRVVTLASAARAPGLAADIGPRFCEFLQQQTDRLFEEW